MITFLLRKIFTPWRQLAPTTNEAYWYIDYNGNLRFDTRKAIADGKYVRQFEAARKLKESYNGNNKEDT